VNGKLYAQVALPPGNETSLTAGYKAEWTQDVFGRFGQDKNLLPPLESNHGSPISLRSCYPNFVTPGSALSLHLSTLTVYSRANYLHVLIYTCYYVDRIEFPTQS
jgi:hypothetical protein